MLVIPRLASPHVSSPKAESFLPFPFNEDLLVRTQMRSVESIVTELSPGNCSLMDFKVLVADDAFNAPQAAPLPTVRAPARKYCAAGALH
jgi:hypothetical protein